VADAYPAFELPEKAEEVLEIVDQIPEGKVLTYGDVAELVGSRGARFVGNVMSRYGSDVPWWRVVRSGGWPPRGLEARARDHYREEGTPMVRGTLDGLRVDMSRARWDGPAS
jgi:alkylated DNA nucleotide flippase Atl1